MRLKKRRGAPGISRFSSRPGAIAKRMPPYRSVPIRTHPYCTTPLSGKIGAASPFLLCFPGSRAPAIPAVRIRRNFFPRDLDISENRAILLSGNEVMYATLAEKGVIPCR